MATYFNYIYKLRVCASFPALMEISDEESLILIEEEIKEDK
jgi:hypothetical protein